MIILHIHYLHTAAFYRSIVGVASYLVVHLFTNGLFTSRPPCLRKCSLCNRLMLNRSWHTKFFPQSLFSFSPICPYTCNALVLLWSLYYGWKSGAFSSVISSVFLLRSPCVQTINSSLVPSNDLFLYLQQHHLPYNQT